MKQKSVRQKRLWIVTKESSVTSFVSPLTNKYAVLENTSGCQSADVTIPGAFLKSSSLSSYRLRFTRRNRSIKAVAFLRKRKQCTKNKGTAHHATSVDGLGKHTTVRPAKT
jgi:hypothetical protein